MTTFSPARNEPIILSRSVEAKVYGFVALAMGLTLLGVYAGILFAATLLSGGMFFVLVIAELAIIVTSRLWADRSPLNILLFCAFPLLSGLTVTPIILMVATGYANGASILLNAVASTVFMTAAAAVFARTTRWNLGVLGKTLFLGILGLLFVGLLQVFFPSLRTGVMELVVSGAGVVLFALFTAFDLQRIQQQSRLGANPFLLALSLYLDIFNLFLYVLRFMLAISGNRRQSW
jgi:FtsH-binding integral membrane protein